MSAEKPLKSRFWEVLRKHEQQLKDDNKPLEERKAFSKQMRLCSLFFARYELAKAFKGIVISPENAVTPNILLGYSVGMRLFLAVSALELAQAVTEKPIESIKIIASDHPALADFFKTFLNKEKTTRHTDENGSRIKVTLAQKMQDVVKHKDRLDSFLKNGDLTGLVYAFRNMFAHGFFTTSGNDLLTQDTVEHFQELTEVLLEKSFALFDEYMQKTVEKNSLFTVEKNENRVFL